MRDRTHGIRYIMRGETRHGSPHLHVLYGGFASSIEIETLRELAGDLPQKQLAEAREWIKLHSAELAAMWPQRLQPGGVYKIQD